MAMLLVLLVAPAVAVIDGFIVVVALPSIQTQLRASDASVQLVIAGYGLVYAALLIAAGRLGDLHGHRRLLVIGLTTFGGTSLVAGLAPNEDVLVAARCAQGGAAALMYPQALGQLRTNFHGRRYAIAMGAYGVTLGLAAITAPLLGGLLVQADVLGLGWRSVFLVNVPITAAAAVIAGRILPARGRGQGRQGVSLDIRMLRRRTFVICLLATLPFHAGEVSFLVLLTIYVQRGMGMEPAAAGLMVMSVAAGFSVVSALLPFAVARTRRFVLSVGIVTAAISTSVLIALVLGGPPELPAALPSLLFIGGVGFGLTIPTLVAAALESVPHESAGAAAGVLVTAQQLGGAVGVAVGGTLFFRLLEVNPISRAYCLALGLDVALFAAAAVLVQVMGDGR